MDDQPKFTRTDKAIGAFVILIIFAVGVFVVGKQAGWLEHSLVLDTNFDFVYGLSKGSPVKMKGHRIGRVMKVEFNRENRFDLRLRVFGKYADRINETGYARISTDILQNPIVDVGTIEFDDAGVPKDIKWEYLSAYAIKRITMLGKKYGGPNAPVPPRLKRGDIITPLSRPDIVELGKEIMKDFQADVQPVVDRMKKSAEHFERIIADMSTISSAVAQGKGTVGRFLHDQDMGEDMRQTIRSTKETLVSVNAIAADLAKTTRALPTMVEEVQRVLTNVKALSEGVAEVTKNVPQLMAQVQTSLQTIDGLTQNLTKISADVPRLMEEVQGLLRSVKVITSDVAKWSDDTPELVQSIQTAIDNTNEILAGLKRSILIRGLLEEEGQRRDVTEQSRTSRYEELTQP